MNNQTICSGCGAILQAQHAHDIGFIEPQHLTSGTCQRCFKINQYSNFQKIDLSNQKLYTMIESFVTQQQPIILVIDIADFLGTCLFELQTTLKNYPIIVLVNKIDLIHRKVRRYDIWHTYMMNIFAEHAFNVTDLFFVSAKENLGISFILKYLNERYQQKQIKIIGCANVGKSSLIQAFFRELSIDTKKAPTVFMTPGTTLNELKISLPNLTLFDTPGIMKPQQLTYHVSTSMMKQIILQKILRPRNYPIYEPQTFYIGGYCQLNIYPTSQNSITFYCNALLPIHRRKLDSDRTFYQQHVGKLLSPPAESEILQHENLLMQHTTHLKITRHKTDIVISGLGWVSVKSAKVRVEVITNSQVLVYTQNALI